MNRTVSPSTVFISLAAVMIALITGISAARSASAEHQARQCVAQGFDAAQCWANASPTF